MKKSRPDNSRTRSINTTALQMDKSTPALKTYRVTFRDVRYFHHDVEAFDAESATAAAKALSESGDIGADSGEPYIELIEAIALCANTSSAT